jgi:hypothetical protein
MECVPYSALVNGGIKRPLAFPQANVFVVHVRVGRALVLGRRVRLESLGRPVHVVSMFLEPSRVGPLQELNRDAELAELYSFKLDITGREFQDGIGPDLGFRPDPQVGSEVLEVLHDFVFRLPALSLAWFGDREKGVGDSRPNNSGPECSHNSLRKKGDGNRPRPR